VSAPQILAAYRLVFGALLLVASVQALVLGRARSHHLVILLAEVAGALLLLCWHRMQWLAAGLLLLVFASAQLISALEGSWPTQFLQYAASTLLIVSLDRALAR